jgi:hypothetical protein
MTEIEKDIVRLVYEKYPKTEKEKCCWQEKQRLSELREKYRRRLESEVEQKKISGIVS